MMCCYLQMKCYKCFWKTVDCTRQLLIYFNCFSKAMYQIDAQTDVFYIHTLSGYHMLSQKGYICIRFRQYNILAWPWIKLATTLVYMVSDKPGVILKYSYGNRKPNTLKSCVVLPILNKWSFSNLVVSANIEIHKFDTHTFYSLHASSPLPTLVGDRVAYSVVSSQVFCRPLLFTYWSFPFWSIYGFWLLTDISDQSYSYFILILELYLFY